jgi:hypothetical protein
METSHMAHSYNSSYSGDRQEDGKFEAGPNKGSSETLSQKQSKNKTAGV